MFVWTMRDKGSEWRAIQNLLQQGPLPFTPLVEAVCEPYARESPKNPASILRALAAKLGMLTGSRRVWVDLGHLLKVFSPNDVAQLHDVLRRYIPQTLVGVTPVIRTSTPSAVLDAVLAWARQRGCGICVRVEGTTHLTNKSETVRAISMDSALSDAEIDLVFDAQDLPRAISQEALRDLFPLSQRARSWIVLAGTFPSSITQMDPDQYEHQRERGEWIAWRDEIELSGLWRRPQYGDYATQPANYAVSLAFPGSPSVRYTIADRYVVLRGRGGWGSTGADYAQFIGHAIYLRQQPYYRDVLTTSGDHYIEQIASGRHRTGNLTTWRVASLERHVQVVAAQVARYAPVLTPIS
jgi:Beta protein